LENNDDVEKAERSHAEIIQKDETVIEIEPIEIDAKLDERITWKFALHIVPWLLGIWVVTPRS